MSSRREFLFGAGKLILILPVGFSIVDALAGCGTAANSCPNVDKVVTSGTSIVTTSSCDESHTHDFTLMTTELSAPPAAGVTRDTSADSFDGHTHSVTLTMADLTQIQAGTTVAKTTTTVNSHSHVFMFKKM